MSEELGFIGAGNMAHAIAKAAIDKKVLSPDQIIVCDINQARLDLFASLGMKAVPTAAQVISQARQILIAVKPQQIEQVAVELAENLSPDQVVITIMAGISSAKLHKLIEAARQAQGLAQSPVRIVRVMPNTPLMAGMGMAGVSLGEHARPGDETLALRLLGQAGKAIVIPENKMDALTAVSGSGPAYLFYLAQAMEKAAWDLGLGEHARLLVAQTLQGSAKLLAESDDSAEELRKKVTSPGGTTQAAVEHMQGNQTMEVLINAVKAAARRSAELGNR